jgi:hypothetical protein
MNRDHLQAVMEFDGLCGALRTIRLHANQLDAKTVREANNLISEAVTLMWRQITQEGDDQ